MDRVRRICSGSDFNRTGADLLKQRLLADPQSCRRLFSIPTGQVQHVLDGFAFDLLRETPTDLAQRQLAGRLLDLLEHRVELGATFRAIRTRSRQLGENRVLALENDHALDHVFEFSNIAWEIVRIHRLDQTLGETCVGSLIEHRITSKKGLDE